MFLGEIKVHIYTTMKSRVALVRIWWHFYVFSFQFHKFLTRKRKISKTYLRYGNQILIKTDNYRILIPLIPNCLDLNTTNDQRDTEHRNPPNPLTKKIHEFLLISKKITKFLTSHALVVSQDTSTHELYLNHKTRETPFSLQLFCGHHSPDCHSDRYFLL